LRPNPLGPLPIRDGDGRRDVRRRRLVVAIFRVRHSAVHCTFNLVMLRFYLYLVSTLAVWFMLARAALAHFGG